VTSLHHLLAALFGARYAGTPLTHCARTGQGMSFIIELLFIAKS